MRITPGRRSRWRLAHEPGRGFREVLIDHPKLGPVTVEHGGHGRPVVLIPGLSGGWGLLSPLARSLAKHCQVWLVSLRGDHAEDPHPHHPPGNGPTAIRDYAEDLYAVIERLELDQPILLGVSFGGAVLLELAARHPERLGGLILQGTEARFGNPLGARIARAVLERYRLPNNHPFINQFVNLLFGSIPPSGPMVDYALEQLWAVDQAEMARRFRALEKFDVSEDLCRIAVPALVLAGAKDMVVTPKRQLALAASLPRGHFASIPKGGHLAFYSHAQETADCIRDLSARVFA